MLSAACPLGLNAGAAAAPAFSPSGHAALSTVVYGGMAVLSGRQVSPLARAALAVFSVLLIALIATSRVAVQAHTTVEVAVGLCIGATAVALLVCLLKSAPEPRRLLPQLAIALVVALATMYGTRWPIEQNLQRLAAWLHQSVDRCS